MLAKIDAGGRTRDRDGRAARAPSAITEALAAARADPALDHPGPHRRTSPTPTSSSTRPPRRAAAAGRCSTSNGQVIARGVRGAVALRRQLVRGARCGARCRSWPRQRPRSAAAPRTRRAVSLHRQACCSASRSLAPPLFRLPRPRLPGRGVLRRGLPREDRAPVPAAASRPRSGCIPPTAKLLIAVGVCALRLRAVGLAPRAGAGRHRARARVLPARAARARDASGRPSSPRVLLLVRRRLPGAEPDRHDQHLRGAVPGRGRAAACCGPRCAGAAARRAWRRLGLVPRASRSRRAGRACGPGASWASCCSWCAGARSSARASWPSARSPSRSLPAAIYLLSYVPWMRPGPSPLADVVAHAGDIWGYHADLQRDPPLLQRVVDVALAVPARPGTTSTQDAELSCAASWPSATPRSGGCRCPSSLWALVTGIRGARPAPPLLRRGLLPPLPAVGPLAAHAQLQPLPVRGHPLRLPDARALASTGTGTAGRRSSRAATSCRRGVLFLFFLPVPDGAPVPTASGTIRFPRRAALDLVPDLGLDAGSDATRGILPAWR